MYILKPLIRQVPLTDGTKPAASITCLEFWEGNLYVGTSEGELLHFVSLPPANSSEDATFILASRLEPTPNTADTPSVGVQRILILPRSTKACVLSNNVLTFHSLPELSPAVGNRKVSGCHWVGGLDLNLDREEGPEEDVVMINHGGVVRILRVSDEAKGISKIQFPGCLEAVRRSRFACVADAHHYALLDIDSQQKIPLFPISSIDETPGATQIEDLQTSGSIRERSPSAPGAGGAFGVFGNAPGHSRQRSLGDSVLARLRQVQQRPASLTRDTNESIAEAESANRTPLVASSPTSEGSRAVSPRPPTEQEKPLPPPPPPPPQARTLEEQPKKQTELLRPHILSVTEEEFLLTTGTGSSEAGVGMFVNLDGDVVRGTLQFDRYPVSVALDSKQDVEMRPAGPDQASEGYVLAAFAKKASDGENEFEAGIEVHRWDIPEMKKSWVSLGTWKRPSEETTEPTKKVPVGVVSTYSRQTIGLNEISRSLKSRRLNLAKKQEAADTVPQSPATKSADDQFWSRMDERSSNVLSWCHDNIYLLVKSPLIMQLEASLQGIMTQTDFKQDQLLQLVGRIQNIEATSEADFLSLAYMRQRISLVAFEDLAMNRLNINPQISEQLVVDSDLDPRVIISTVPLFRDDIDQGASGLRLSQGLINLVEERFAGLSVSLDPDEVLSRPDDYDILGLVKRYLQAWRKKKGYGSIADEANVVASVDAALLHLLLQQDVQSSSFPGQMSTLSVELYALVDGGVSCPDRAIQLLEEYKRLYALSRLYGKRRESAKVLQTWKRMMEGEGDAAGEFQNPDGEMRRYLGYMKDRDLVEEYGTYLARRNPMVGVQVFTDESSKVKLQPSEVVTLLQAKAPEAVKVYLEHLVFGKKNFRYADELISYYLNSVLNVLDDPDDDAARTMLESSYQTYRALAPPKPTYRQFIAENAAPDLGWWSDRLRLLELLGGTFGADFNYDVDGVQSRIKPYSQWLVPESIILDGRQGNHLTALRLLTHGLGDYHTAVNYCMLGGASIFHPAMATAAGVQPPDREEQRSLFTALFHEFLKLEDEDRRREQVGILLSRFEGWFVIEDVLPHIPEAWPLETIEGFLVGAIRRIVQEKAETMIIKALSGAENIIVANEFAEKSQSGGPLVTTEERQVA